MKKENPSIIKSPTTPQINKKLINQKNDHNSILIRSGILTPSVYVSIKEWIITFLFNTKHLFSEPFISSSPRDFWSTRWQLLINESFKELGYLPVKNLFVSIFSRKIANIMGVLSAFGISASLHEYLIIANAYTWTGEHFFFFMTRGVIFILWEVVFISNKSKNENTMIEKFLKWVLFLIINLILLPALIEPSMRNFDFSDISSISKNFVDYSI
ncbi:hypothetical protein RhiirA5_423836 [Rhizophagus irregularis]|uniref:Wax synthase domain-containing protein n=1 Tax=Rhizophagus irregularis TaxID=588596 RepID=A0A2N0P9B7_9GLOM|nr:hypothetical protein RhiirA5_423836 [Rhizophagus irregularis]PKC59989.1 hypothetical protein RhiirA1_468667 [Rhizophagus irregularis]CAB5389766.1 unnamed protein product [Rhizophagus irregularis]